MNHHFVLSSIETYLGCLFLYLHKSFKALRQCVSLNSRAALFVGILHEVTLTF